MMVMTDNWSQNSMILAKSIGVACFNWGCFIIIYCTSPPESDGHFKIHQMTPVSHKCNFNRIVLFVLVCVCNCVTQFVVVTFRVAQEGLPATRATGREFASCIWCSYVPMAWWRLRHTLLHFSTGQKCYMGCIFTGLTNAFQLLKLCKNRSGKNSLLFVIFDQDLKSDLQMH